MGRAQRWWVAAGIFAVLVGYMLVRDFGATAYDDSYFFKRFALNALDHGVFAWNVQDGPVYGSTSQLYQLLTTVVVALNRSHFVVVMRCVNAVLLVGLGVWLTRHCARDSERGDELALLALATPLVLTSLLSGMETALTLLVVGVAVAGRHRPPAQAAGLTVLVYLCRPDAALIPAAAVCIEHALRREVPWRYLAWLGGAMALVLLGFWAYYGSALPLSFYMKSVALENYGDHFVSLGLMQKREHFGATLAFAIPLLWLARRARGPDLALLIAVGLFWGYHLISTLEIMGYRGRFYLPAFVPLAMVAARCWDRKWSPIVLGAWAACVAVAYYAELIPTGEGWFLAGIPWPAYAATIAAAALVFLVPRRYLLGIPLLVGVVAWRPPHPVFVLSDDKMLRRHGSEVTTVRGVWDVHRCLPDAKAVYHSEMGVTGLVLADTRVVDLAGIVSRPEPFEEACARDRPEAIFLPHKNYEVLNARIAASACFADYRRAIDRSSSPLHIRADLYDDFMHCAAEAHRWRGKPR